MGEVRGSQTAEFMAFFRVLETLGPAGKRLFADPFAIAFLGPGLRGVARLSRNRVFRGLITRLIDALWPGARPAGVARTRLIDDALDQALYRGGFEQVVLLGAGFDARAYRLPCLAHMPVFEVDHPNTLDEKRRHIESLSPSPSDRSIYVSMDFNRQPLADALAKAGFNPNRCTFFLLEGVTNYLTGEAVDSLLRFVSSAVPGSRLLFTYVHLDVLSRTSSFHGTWLLRRTLRRANELWTFGLDPACLDSYLRARGLVLVRDEGSREYRERYLGNSKRLLRGYEFYRAAIADVPPRP